MKPATRATMSTLLIAVTRPRNSPVSVTWRLATGVTETAGGGGALWAMARPQQASRPSAAMAHSRDVSRPGITVLLTTRVASPCIISLADVTGLMDVDRERPTA